MVASFHHRSRSAHLSSFVEGGCLPFRRRVVIRQRDEKKKKTTAETKRSTLKSAIKARRPTPPPIEMMFNPISKTRKFGRIPSRRVEGALSTLYAQYFATYISVCDEVLTHLPIRTTISRKPFFIFVHRRVNTRRGGRKCKKKRRGPRVRDAVLIPTYHGYPPRFR